MRKINNHAVLVVMSLLVASGAFCEQPSRDQKDYAAMTELGDASLERGDRKAALKYYKKAAEIAPGYPAARFMLGRLYYLTGRYDEAVSELSVFKEKMLAMPKMDDETKRMYLDSLRYSMEVYFTLKRYKEARQEIEELLRLEPGDQNALYNLGVCYYVAERSRPRAYEAFKKVIAINPDSEEAASARYAIEYLRRNPDPRFAPDFSFLRRTAS